MSDNPTGPFVDKGTASIEKHPEGINGGHEVNPDVFPDSKNGKTYLYWANRYTPGLELNEDRISIKPGSAYYIKN